MTKRIFVGVCIAVLALNACTSNKKEEKKAAEETIIEDATLQKVEDKVSTLSDWQQYYVQKVPDFSLDNFEPVGTEKVNDMYSGMELNQKFYDLYGKLLVYSPDSTRFMDIYSYNFIVERRKDGTLSARMGEPDQEAAVVDVKTGKRLRLWFCGPHCLLEKAIWLNNEEVALVGIVDEDGNEVYQPQMWVINIKTGQTTLYSYPQEIKNMDPVEFTRSMLNKKGINYEG